MTDYYPVGLPLAISGNLLARAGDEQHVQESGWLADPIPQPKTLQQRLDDHFKIPNKTKTRNVNF